MLRISGFHSQWAMYSSDTSRWRNSTDKNVCFMQKNSGVKLKHLLIIHKKTYDRGENLLTFKIDVCLFLTAALFLICCHIIGYFLFSMNYHFDFCTRYFKTRTDWVPFPAPWDAWVQIGLGNSHGICGTSPSPMVKTWDAWVQIDLGTSPGIWGTSPSATVTLSLAPDPSIWGTLT